MATVGLRPDPEHIAYANQVFGEDLVAAEFYLREILSPGEFEALAKVALARKKAEFGERNSSTAPPLPQQPTEGTAPPLARRGR